MIFEQLAFALKTKISLKCLRQGGGRPPDPPPRTHMLLGLFQSKILYTLQLQRGPEASASLAFPLNTLLYSI